MSGEARWSKAGVKDLRAASQPRSMYGDKRQNGSVLLVGGSGEFHGAPSLAANAAYNALAALRMGTGYVILYVPAIILNPVRALSPNLIVRGFGKKDISNGAMAALGRQMLGVDYLAIGNGIGREKKALGAASKIIKSALSLNKKIVVDADAVYALKGISRLNGNVVVTPQDREFSSLYGSPPGKYLDDRIRSAVSLARKTGASVLLKGHDTIITDGKRTKVVHSKSSALATMGTGDVLSGMIGGYMAAGAPAFEAAVAAAYLHSKIGDILNREKGNHILASDIVDLLPRILRRFDKDTR